jgi:hypothetical protein
LIALGLAGFLGTGSAHPTALIPTWIGLALGIGGLLAISPSERRRKLFMHFNVTIGLLGFIGSAVEIARSILVVVHHAKSLGVGTNAISFSPDFLIALASKLTLAVLLFIYVLLCVQSFIAARRSGKV